MTRSALCRSLAHSLAPLCERPGEGAQATELRQDKRDSLRLGLAVGLLCFVNMFAHAAVSESSLLNAPNYRLSKLIRTSSTDAHVR